MRVAIIYLIVFSILFSYCGDDKKSPAPVPSGGTSMTNDTTTKDSTEKTILFFGNSLTAGYGVDPSQAFPALVQKKIDSSNLPYKAINAGVSGETSSGGLARIDWILRQAPDVFVLELGANDGLRGIPLSETKKNLQAIINKVKEKNPDTRIVIAGMMMPPNMGPKYTKEFQAIYADLAHDNQLSLIPFLLEGVGGEAALNQDDGIHPTPEGHKIVAENVWVVLKGVL
jgi:acyl-CoA thioesterase-1